MTAENLKSQAVMRMDRCSLRRPGLQAGLIPGCLEKAKKDAPEEPPERLHYISAEKLRKISVLVAFHLVEEHVPVDLALMAADRLRLLHVLLDSRDMAELCGNRCKLSGREVDIGALP